MLSEVQQQALVTLINTSREGYLTDIEAENISHNTMQALIRRKFAKLEGDGLYRATLAGIAYLEAGIEAPIEEPKSGIAEVAEMVKRYPGLTLPQIRALVTVPDPSVGEFLKTLFAEDRVRREGTPKNYRYYPTEKIDEPRPREQLRQQILSILSREPQPAADIAKALGRDSSTIHGSLRKLAAAGMVVTTDIPVPFRKPLKGWMLP